MKAQPLLRKPKLSRGLDYLASSAAIKDACTRKREKLANDFGSWVAKTCIGWTMGMSNPPTYNFISHANSGRYTFVTVGFDQYLVRHVDVPKKFYAALGLFKPKKPKRRKAN